MQLAAIVNRIKQQCQCNNILINIGCYLSIFLIRLLLCTWINYLNITYQLRTPVLRRKSVEFCNSSIHNNFHKDWITPTLCPFLTIVFVFCFHLLVQFRHAKSYFLIPFIISIFPLVTSCMQRPT